jgi:hypothetical protein
MKTKETILEKVRKLLALANDAGASEGEIENALMFAQKLMMKHSIEQSEVEMCVNDVNYTDVPNPWVYGESKSFAGSLLNIIAKSNACRMIIRGSGDSKYYTLVGFKEDREVTLASFEQTLASVRVLGKKRFKESDKKASFVKFYISYLAGFNLGLYLKLEENKKVVFAIAAEAMTYDLMIVKKDALLADFIADEFGRLGKTKSRNVNLNMGAFNSGKSDGSQSSTTKQLH